MIRRILLPFILVILTTLGESAFGAKPVRIAIIDTNLHDDLEPLLVAELSKATCIELVERGEINRIIDEKKLCELAGSGKFAGLGSLIHADGLLVIESVTVPGKSPVTMARLISVKTGACMMRALPPENSGGKQAWAVWMSRDVVRMAPKLLVTRENAILISVLNIRASLLNPENVAIESSVTRLVESRLVPAANVILLDRRRLDDVEFERGLDATDLPELADSAVVVDGSFLNEQQRDKSITVNVRLRQKNGVLLASLTVRGKSSDVPALAESITAAVLEALKQPAPNSVWDRSQEAVTFFEEAVWAWRAGAFTAAEEALAAARALGDHSPDLAALEAWLFREQAWPVGFFRNWPFVPEGCVPPPDKQNVAFLRAFESLKEFEASGAKLTRFNFETGMEFTLHTDLVETASIFLRRSDESARPIDVEMLREVVREAGGMGTDEIRMPDGLGVAAKYCPAWARNRDELIAYYEKLFRTPLKTDLGRSRMLRQDRGKLLKGFPRSPAEALGIRFRNDPQAVLAWKELLDRMCADPATRLRALLARAGTAETDSQAADYRDFLLELGRQAPALTMSNQLGQFLEAVAVCRSLPKGMLENRSYLSSAGGLPFHTRYPKEDTELLLTLCKTLPRFERNLSFLVYGLTIPEDLRQETWDAYCAYQDRCIQKKDSSKPLVNFSSITASLLAANPGLVHASDKATEGLLVHRFWDPYHLPLWQWDMLQLREVVPDDSDVWIVAQGIVDHSRRAMIGIFKVRLPSFESSLLHVDGVKENSHVALAPDALWMISAEGNLSERFLVRYDRQTGESRRWPAPCWGKLSVVNGRIFVSFKSQGSDAGLEEFDPKTGDWRLVISSRRNPPESPLDDLPQWDPGQVIAGPGGKLYVAGGTGNSDRNLYELGNAFGKWSSVSVSQMDLVHSDKTSLIYGRNGVVFIDPEKDAPEWWAAEAQAKAPWEPQYAPSYNRSVAFRPRELFVLGRDERGTHQLHCWFEGGPREGVVFPLRFQFPSEEIEFLEPRKAKFVDVSLVHDIALDNLIDPNTMSVLLKLHATRDGLILSCPAHGFWFIPNDELHAAIEGACRR